MSGKMCSPIRNAPSGTTPQPTRKDAREVVPLVETLDVVPARIRGLRDSSWANGALPRMREKANAAAVAAAAANRARLSRRIWNFQNVGNSACAHLDALGEFPGPRVVSRQPAFHSYLVSGNVLRGDPVGAGAAARGHEEGEVRHRQAEDVGADGPREDEV